MQTTRSVEQNSEDNQDELEQRFLRTKERTEGDIVYASVSDVSLVEEDNIEIEYELPSGRTKYESMEFPEPMTEDFKWVRMCESIGLNPKVGPRIADCDVGIPVQKKGESYVITPRQDSSRLTNDMISNAIYGTGWFFAPTVMILKLYTEWQRSSESEDTKLDEEDLLVFGLTSVLWQAVVFLLISLFIF